MKNIFIATSLMLSAVLTVSQANAQNTTQASPFSHLKARACMLLARQQQTAAKPSGGNPERLIASSFYSNLGELIMDLTDSTRYVYTDPRTSLLTNQNIFSYQDYFDPVELMLPPELMPSSYNYIQYDSALHYGMMPTILPLSRIHTKTYDAQNRVTVFEKMYVDGMGERLRYLISYAGNMAMPDTVWMQYDTSADLSGQFENIMALTVTYDGSNRRIADTLHYYNTGSKQAIQYQYTIDGLLAQATIYTADDGVNYEVESRSNYAYDNMGRLIVDLEEYNAGSGLENDYVDSFFYTGSNMLYTSDKGYYWDEGSWEPDFLHQATFMPFEAYNEVTISYYDGTGTMEPAVSFKLFYNEHQHMTSQAVYYANEGVFDTTAAQVYNYYYEDMPTGVSGVMSGTEVLQVYPNPATTHLFVSAEGETQVVVYNLSGQLLLQQNGIAQNGKLQVNIARLPAGTYLADVQTEKHRGQVKFIKQ